MTSSNPLIPSHAPCCIHSQIQHLTMFSLFSLSVVAVLAAVARAQGALTINTPVGCPRPARPSFDDAVYS